MNNSATNKLSYPKPVVLLTRPAEASERFVAALGLPNDQVVISPVLQIQHMADVPPIPSVGTLIFTSEHAVHAFGGPWCETIFVVGTRTEKALHALGHHPKGTFDTARALLAHLPRDLPEPIYHIRGAHVAAQIGQSLRDQKRAANDHIVYDQIAQPLSDQAKKLLLGEQVVVLPLFSPRSAALVSSEVDRIGGSAPLVPIAMSEAIAKAWGNTAAECHIVARPKMSDMVDNVLRHLNQTAA